MDHGGEQGEKKGEDKEGMRELDHDGMNDGSGDMSSDMLMANGEYFDERFIDTMVPHHESAIEMANVALENSDNPDIREIARAIVEAQEKEIAQMEGWREEWYSEG